MTAWRFHGIGTGIEYSDLVPVKATLKITQDGGKNASAALKKEDLLKISKGEEPTFWYVPAEKNYENHPMHEVNDVDDDVASDRVHHNPANAREESPYFCPICSASFVKYGNLVVHLSEEKHKVRPDRVSLLDYALGLFKGYLEEIRQSVALLPLSDSLRALQTGTDEELPKGWALRGTKKSGFYPEKSKLFVKTKFEEAKAAKRKLRAEEVELLLKAEDLIKPEERMTLDQIKNYIRTLASPPKTSRQTR